MCVIYRDFHRNVFRDDVIYHVFAMIPFSFLDTRLFKTCSLRYQQGYGYVVKNLPLLDSLQYLIEDIIQ
jgi:hypothetical protein